MEQQQEVPDVPAVSTAARIMALPGGSNVSASRSGEKSTSSNKDNSGAPASIGVARALLAQKPSTATIEQKQAKEGTIAAVPVSTASRIMALSSASATAHGSCNSNEKRAAVGMFATRGTARGTYSTASTCSTEFRSSELFSDDSVASQPGAYMSNGTELRRSAAKVRPSVVATSPPLFRMASANMLEEGQDSSGNSDDLEAPACRGIVRVESSNSFGSSKNEVSTNCGLAVAEAVREDGRIPQPLNFPQAMEVELNNENEEIISQENKKKRGCSLVSVGSLLLLPALVVFLVSLWLSKDEPNSRSPTLPPSIAPSESPSSMPSESRILSLLPDHTITRIRSDPESPQALAFEWMLADPNLTSYSSARLIQRFALVTFFHATNGFDWANNANWLSYDHHECLWFASDFEEAIASGYVGDPYVIEHNPLVSRLSNESFPCAHDWAAGDDDTYQHLWLFFNKLNGQIPEELYLLTSLKSIVFLADPLVGSTLSTSIGQLTNMEMLVMAHSGISGTIPTQVGKLSSSLHTLHVFANQLQGTIPSQLGLLSAGFTGDLGLDGNQLTGTLPSELSSLTGLSRLFLSSNQLTGTMPTEFGLMTSLWNLAVFANQLTGTIPSQLGKLDGDLTRLTLYDNQLTGTIPSELGDLAKLVMAFVHKNKLSGTLPSQLGRLTSLEGFPISSNDFTGTIPKELGALVEDGSLVSLHLTETMITGSIHQEFCGMGLNATCPWGKWFKSNDVGCGLRFDCTEDLCGCDCPC